MPTSTADATWYGTVAEGSGEAALGSDAWQGAYGTPMADDATDPEELLAAGHASCFAMTAAFLLAQSGYRVERVSAEAEVTLERTDAGFEIPEITITVDGEVPDATAEEFDALVRRAEAACPVSNALEGTAVSVAVAHTA